MITRCLLVLVALGMLGCETRTSPPPAAAPASSTAPPPPVAPVAPVNEPVTLQQHIDRAIASGAASVTLPAGTHRLSPPSPHLVIRNARNLAIDATGVTVIATSLHNVLLLDQCQNVTIRGLIIDYDPLPFTQGVITAMDPDGTWIEAKLDAGYPPLEGTTAVLTHDAVTRHVKPQTWTRHGVSVEAVGERSVRLTSQKPVRDATAVGDPVTMIRKTLSPHAVMSRRCSGLVFEDVTVHASTSFAIYETMCDASRYERCRVTPGPVPPGATTPRLRASNADGIHSKHAKVGPTIRHCLLDRMGDDGIAINGDFAIVVAADDSSLLISPKNEPTFSIGDRLQGLSSEGIPTDDVVTVTQIEPVSGDDVPDMDAVRAAHYPRLVRADRLFRAAYRVHTDRPLPVKSGDAVSSPDRNGSGFLIEHNTIAHNRARGMLIKASHGTVAHNTIDGSSMAGIVLCPETTYWMESSFSEHVTIADNTIRNVNAAIPNPGSCMAGAISLVSEELATADGHRHIIIERNTIENARGINLLIAAARDVTVRHNRFVNTHATPGGHGENLHFDPSAVVWVGMAGDVTVEANTLTRPGPHFTSPLIVGEGVTNLRGKDTGVTPTASRPPQD